VLVWLPDGSLHASGYLDASFTHKEGMKAYGARLETGVVPRYGRLWDRAYGVYFSSEFQALKSHPWDIPAFESEINENYACEYLYFELTYYPDENWLTLKVHDRYSGRAIAENEE
jgi:hypothetical protein